MSMGKASKCTPVPARLLMIIGTPAAVSAVPTAGPLATNGCRAAGASHDWAASHAADADAPPGHGRGLLVRRGYGGALLGDPLDEERGDARCALVPAGHGLAAVPAAGR